jgi:hypothetical protein
MRKALIIVIAVFCIIGVLFFIILEQKKSEKIITGKNSLTIPQRESLIPSDAIKMGPENDKLAPKLLSDEFEKPILLAYPANTKGLEDSPFIMPDGNTIYIWFTPNNKMDVIEQSKDMVTGIYKFKKTEDGWSEPERVWLVNPGEPHLDGCGFFQEDSVWICGARQGYTGLKWFKSKYSDGKWSIAEYVDFRPEYEVGELHISNDGNTLYFHSSMSGGKGGLDIWRSKKIDGKWQEPENLVIVNSERDDGWPALNPIENELWITRDYGIWRSKKIDGKWQEPEKIISDIAGEATLDKDDNVFFTHHYFEDGKMIESDIYVAYRKNI